MINFSSGDYCSRCGRFTDADKLRMVESWVESGRSGGSTTFRGSQYGLTWGQKSGRRRGGGVSYNTGRTYYKKVKQLVCTSCLKQEAEQAEREAEQRRLLWISGISIVVILYIADYIYKLFI